MNKKKLGIMIASVALIASVGVGATLAYFTDSTETMPNVITTGNVNITISENKVERKEGSIDYVRTDDVVYVNKGLEFDNIIPGQTVPKNPTVSLVELSRDAYIRVTLDVVSDDELTNTNFKALLATFKEDLLESIDNKPEWVLGSDNKLYYQQKLTKSNPAKLFDTITIPTSWNNFAANCKFSITIQAEAIQADYLDKSIQMNTNNVPEISNWDSFDIEPQ